MWAVTTGASVPSARRPTRPTTTTRPLPTTTTKPPPTTTTKAPSGGSSTPTIGGCPVFPADNAWNTDVTNAPLDLNSSAYISNILANGGGFLHADFGGGGAYGIPYITVNASTPMVPINFTAYGDESDPGPYPVPLTAPIEGGASSTGDRHVLAVNTATCRLYEMYGAFPQTTQWNADSGAVFDFTSDKLRPDGWTSADAAGLPILPGLVRYDEVAAGAINHALRFTVNATQRGYIHPATHFASSSTDATRPPMGLRLRLKAGYDVSGFHGEARVVLDALKHYGMIVADNGSNFFITGAADPRWDDNDLNQLKSVPGSAFEVVSTGPILK